MTIIWYIEKVILNQFDPMNRRRLKKAVTRIAYLPKNMNLFLYVCIKGYYLELKPIR